ncbi:fungal-specific transcription factor domain-containing protein [Nemania sp. FL0031]|nr:fungal-specific transcription factor domain-containing protein [Nemania sp. FL0031]
MPSSKAQKRHITACSECYRRKQKCDRKRPCQWCIRRQVIDRCSYGGNTISATREAESRESDVNHGRQEVEAPLRSAWDTVVPIQDQIGYPRSQERNPVLALEKRIPGGFRYDFSDSHTQDGVRLEGGGRRKQQDLLARLPSPSVIGELVDVYFHEANQCYQLLERYYFDKLFITWMGHSTRPSSECPLPRELIYFPALIFQVLAVALQFLPNGTTAEEGLNIRDQAQRNTIARMFSSFGEDFMTSLGRQNSTIIGIQHDLMRAFHLKNDGRGTVAWHSIGNAIRQAQDQGFHLHNKIEQSSNSVEETLAKVWEDEHRRRLWLVLFTWDSNMAATLNRPRMIHMEDCTVQRPTACDFPQNPLSTLPKGSSIDERPCSIAPQLFSYEIGVLIHEMLSSRANTRHVPSYDIVLKLDSKARTMMTTSLTPALRPTNPDTTWDSQVPGISIQREFVKVNANMFFLSLHRDHISLHEESLRVALSSALAVLEAQTNILSKVSEHQSCLYGLSCHTIDASLFLAHIMITAPPPDPSLCHSIRAAIHKAAAQLSAIGDKSQLAKCGSKILSRYIQTFEYEFGTTAASVNEMEASLEEPVALAVSSELDFFTLDRFRPEDFEALYPPGDLEDDFELNFSV